MNKKNIISIKNTSYTYLANTPFEKKALNSININITKNEAIGVLGKTGSGKSTLCQLLSGLITPNQGEVIVAGINTKNKHERKDLWKHVGMVMQFPEYQIFEETTYEEIAFGLKNMQLNDEEIRKRINKISENLSISEETLKKNPLNLSGGMKKIISLASILVMNTEILIIDEPTVGLDNKIREHFIDKIKQIKKTTTIILVSHNTRDIIEICDRIIVFNEGNIELDGEKEEIFSEKNKLEKLGILPPDITEITYKLKKSGLNTPQCLTNGDAANEISKILAKPSEEC